MYYKMMYESPLGPMILAASDTALVGAWFEGQKYCYGALQGKSYVKRIRLSCARRRTGWMIILPGGCRLS